jgi:hypothetical protein
MKYFFYLLLSALFLFGVSVPVLYAQSTGSPASAVVLQADAQGTGLVPCVDDCGFADLLTLINNVIEFLITKLFIPIVVLVFMYGGYQYIAAQGNPTKKANVKKMLLHLVVGMLFVLCSWLIVKTVLNILLRDTTGTLLQ